MDFLTQEQVQEASKDELSALECSWTHHHQGATADYVELRDAIKDKGFGLGLDWCSMCERHNPSCVNCSLTSNSLQDYHCQDYHCCDGIYHIAHEAFGELEKDFSNVNFKAFQDAEAKICTYIRAVIDKKKAEKIEFKRLDSLCKKESKAELDYSKPIIAIGKDSYLVMLIPTHKDGIYNIAGYDWVKMSDGSLNSCCCWKTAEEAVRCYRTSGYEVRNHIFDDLQRNSEDLEEFEVSGQYDEKTQKTFVAKISRSNDIWIHINTCSSNFSFDRATEIAHKILQEVATAKRKKASKE